MLSTITRRMLAVLVLGAARSLAAQQPSLTLTSALRAREVVKDAVDAMGGMSALQGLETVVRDMRGPRTDPGQQLTPLAPGAAPGVQDNPHMISVRDHRRMRAAEFLGATIKGGQPLVRRTAVSGATGMTVLYDYVWHSVRAIPPQAVPNVRARLFRGWPEGLLLAASNRPESLRWLGEAAEGGGRQHVLSYADVDGTQLTLYFDAATHLLTKTETTGDDPVAGDVTYEMVYDDWRPVGTAGLRLPFRSQERVAGLTLQELRADSIVTNVALSDTLFTAPDSFAKLEAPAPAAVTKLSEDVYVVFNAYESMFVVFDDHVMVLEAGGAPNTAQFVIDNVKRIAPGKPIRYVVATHAHHDHLAGIRPYIAEGVTIVTTAAAQTVVERAARATHALRPDALSRAPQAPRFDVVTGDKRVFSDGRHEVVLYRLAPTPHVSEMLFAYLPKEKTLFVADALDIEEPGRTGTGGDDTVQLAKKIDELGLAVDHVVPVHGRMGTMEDLRRSLSRRGAKVADK